MNTETKRPTFEAWCETQSLETGRDNGGDYISLETALSWEAWQAALASQEVQALREALIESDNQLKQVLASNTDGLVHVVNDEFHLCLEKNRSALAAMEKRV